MSTDTIYFFATKSDTEAVLRAVEDGRTMKYIDCKMYLEKKLKSFNSWADLPSFGYSLSGDVNHDPMYLVADVNTEVVLETVPQRKGGERHFVSQYLNPDTVVFRHGGLHKESGSLIEGSISTISESVESKNLFQLFAKQIKKHFTKIKGNYLGGEALRLFESGARLTASIKAPKGYDLSRD